ncbi:MAG TPA: hypothetical protein VGR20_01725 [Acidimicrobiia bacterium]|nr:hypothetical protein [Acidimicrobiia bacterium]
MADLLTAERFAPHRGTEFIVDLGDGGPAVPLRLDHVTPAATQPGAPREDPFSLEFSGPPAQTFPQGLYEFAHATLGSVAIFVVPIGPGPEGRPRYEAVFN